MANDWKSKYDEVGPFEKGLARVNVGGKYVISEEPEDVDCDEYTLEGGQYGFVDEQGNEVVPLMYDDAWHFSEGLAAVQLKGKWGFIDKKGNEYWDMTEDEARQHMQNR